MSNDDVTNKKIEVRDLRQGDWLWAHKALLFSQHISPSDFKVYCGLASYAGNADQQSFPSLSTLATKLNMSKTTVIRSLKWLEACRLVSVERRDGFSNLYLLLQCTEIKPPRMPARAESPHQRLIAFFHDQSKSARNVKPMYAPKDVARLKTILGSTMLSVDQIERLMLYYLASPRFKKYPPTLSVFFSAGIFTGLINSMKNDPKFWKEMDMYTEQYLGKGVHRVTIAVQSMDDMIKQLEASLSVRHQSHVD